MDKQNELKSLLRGSNCTYIGWDVGGMHGVNNALCILNSVKEEELEITFGISKKKTPELLARHIAEHIVHHSGTTTLLAIDAPLAFPRAFVSYIKGEKGESTIPYTTQISNPLAYRNCESYLHTATGKRPLSASFDQLTSLVLLVQRVLQLVTELSGKKTNRLPFDAPSVTKGINAFECYPALLKPLKKPLKSGNDKKQLFDSFVERIGFSFKTSHEMDAQYCALFAVYEHLVNAQGFEPHSDYSGNLSEEGWIYGPY